jgi:hypothetical protein
MKAYAQCPTPLYLRVATDIAMLWPSSFSNQSECRLGANMRAIVTQVFERLEKFHGAKLVGNALAYLVTARYGLSSSEMEDVLSSDEEVLSDDVFKWWSPPVRRLPPLLWKRLKEDLGRYIVDKGVQGSTVHALYHRQFWETVQALYLSTDKERRDKATHLANFFDGVYSSPTLVPYLDKDGKQKAADKLISPQPLKFSATQYNRRKLSELPYLQIKSENNSSFDTSLFNFEFIEAKVGAAMVDELLEDYNTAISALVAKLRATTAGYVDTRNADEKCLHTLQQFQRFVRKVGHLVSQSPKDVLMHALNEPDGLAVTEYAKEQRKKSTTQMKKVF